ncbi:MAG: LPXTG cell wall anchor domain-containing protein, partial [Agathobacter sp.]|nr:LPXTG cell wall anchor domain-containing protein [Agathobacter sp.]
YETDQFSTYALAYVDQQNNDVKVEVPKTGDASNAYIWFILALVSGIGALYLGKKGLVLKKEN